MIARPTRLSAAVGFSGALVLSTASCSMSPRTAAERTVEDESTRPVAVRPAPPLRVVQLNFGGDAYFAACAEPACPAVTQKTLPRSELPQSVALVRPALELPVVEPPPAPQPVPPSKPIPTKEEEVHIHVTFPFGSASLTDSAKETLRRALPNARGSDHVVISGRTDNLGSEEVNRKLAQARAFAVRNYIRDAVPDLPRVIDIDAKGRCCFIASNDSEDGRGKNRRVEVVFISRRAM